MRLQRCWEDCGAQPAASDAREDEDRKSGRSVSSSFEGRSTVGRKDRGSDRPRGCRVASQDSHEDARIVADGGGVVGSSPKPIVAAEKSPTFFTSSRKLGLRPRVQFHNRMGGYDRTRPVAPFILSRRRSRIARLFAEKRKSYAASFTTVLYRALQDTLVFLDFGRF